MGQISEESVDAQNVAKNLIEVIVNEAMKTVNKRKEPNFNSFESLKLQSLDNEEILACVKSKGMSLEEMKQGEYPEQASVNDICYQNVPEVCIHNSILSTQGEGDFQPPLVRETKAFHHLIFDDISGSEPTFVGSPSLSERTSLTDELISQVHCEINNLSFDHINFSDSEIEKELQTKESGYDEESSSQEGQESKIQVNQCCQTNSEKEIEEDNHELRHSPKFSHLKDLNRYYRLKNNSEERENEEERDLLSTSSEELICVKNKDVVSCVNNFSQTNPFRDPFICSNVNSTIALSSDCCELRDEAETNRETVFVDADMNGEGNEWVEANEVEIRITEPGCSKEYLQMDSTTDNEVVHTKEFWSNVGLITERTVDHRYLGPVEIPGIDSIKGVTRVEEKYLTREPEEIIWVTEVERLEESMSSNVSQEDPKERVNYLTFPESTGGKKKKNKVVSRLTKAISSIFKLTKKNSKH